MYDDDSIYGGLQKIDDENGSEVQSWEVGEGWETDPALAPASPAAVGAEALKRKLGRTRRLGGGSGAGGGVGDISEISDRWKAISQDPGITRDDVLP